MKQIGGRSFSLRQHGRKWLAAEPPDPPVQQALCAAAPAFTKKARERIHSLGGFFVKGLRCSPVSGEQLRIVLTWRVLKAVRYWEGTNPSVFSLRSNPPPFQQGRLFSSPFRHYIIGKPLRPQGINYDQYCRVQGDHPPARGWGQRPHKERLLEASPGRCFFTVYSLPAQVPVV